MTCRCDTRLFPATLAIPAGLSDLPRQLAGFPEFRAAMLALIPQKPALAGWRARGDDDFGVMLLEMWAYVCDVVSFYDKLVADESYLRTAKLRPSVRKLVSLLGYVPRPAVAAAVRLALLAEGQQPIVVAPGTAFRSAAFGAEPPQVFELDVAASIHPAANQWKVAPPPVGTLSGSQSRLLCEPGKSAIKDGDHLLIDCGAAGMFVRKAALTTRMTDAGNKTWVRVDLDAPFTPAGTVSLASLKIYKPTRTAQLRNPVVSGEEAPFNELSPSHLNLQLDGVYTDIKENDRVLVSKGDDFRWSALLFRSEETYVVVPERSFTVDGTSVTTPVVTARFTMLHLNPSVRVGATTWSNADSLGLTVHFGLVEAGRPGNSDALTLADDDPLQLLKVVAPAAGPPPASRFFLVDKETRGEELGGSLDWTTGRLTADPGTSWSPPLVLPVNAFGNVVSATRGQTVPAEVLGSGDGAQANQSFVLAKKPLTYVASPTAGNDAGIASTLVIWVDGVRWSEAPTFFGQDPAAQVYVVRQKDDGSSVVTFGDGVHGARLTTGAGNVIASYRFGAGAATPPAGSIAQLAKPVKGLKRVLNPVAAAGGADPDSAEKLRTLAPKSALLLGRAISIQDMEAATAAVPGVIAAAAAWRWDGKRQRPVAKIWYIGAAGLETTVSQRLRAITDPSTPIDVEVATPVVRSLTIDVETDPRHVADDVAAAVQAALLDPDTGLLANERIGIGKALFRSTIFAEVLEVAGATGVRALLWNRQPWLSYGKKAPPGTFFDFEAGNLFVSGSAGAHV
jgi:hypothetical protein